MNTEIKKQHFGIIDAMLVLGLIGAIETIITQYFWLEIIQNDSLKIFWPDRLLQKLCVLAVIIGLIGFFNYITAIFTESGKANKRRHLLAIGYIVCFSVVSYFFYNR